MSKSVIISLVIIFLFGLAIVVPATAQTDAATEEGVIAEVAEDEAVDAADLDVTEPKVLPDSPWYGLKKFWEGVQEAFVFNPVKRAELQLQRANQRLIEAQALAEKNGNPEAFERVMANYEKRIQNIHERMEKLSETHADQTEKFLEKFTEYELKHNRLLEKLEDDVSEEQAEVVTAAKERALEALAAALARVDNETAAAKIQAAMDRIAGSDLKELKNLEVLKALEEKVPEQAREAIIRAQQNTLRRLGEDLEDIPEVMRGEKFEMYLKHMRGDEVRRLELIKYIEENNFVPRDIQQRIRSTKAEAVEMIEERVREVDGATLERLRLRLEMEPELEAEIMRTHPALLERVELEIERERETERETDANRGTD